MDNPAGCHKILVADDDSNARELVKLGLSAAGYQVFEAEDGLTALETYNREAPDLAILDMMMPGYGGSELCKIIKSNEFGLQVPVIILTALDKLDQKVQAFDCGADDYLTKPFHFDELQARVRALLRVRHLNLSLIRKNQELQDAQQKLVEREKQLVVMQLAGTAAHQLGQPISAIILNCHLLEKLPPDDERHGRAIAAIKQDAQRMAELIEKLKQADPKKKEQYCDGTQILALKKS